MRLRASSLPGFTDCSRRAASKVFAQALKEDGYEFRQNPPSIGSVIGTAAHHGAAAALKAKFYRQRVSASDIVDPAMEQLKEEIAPGAIWDAATPNVNAAQHQVRSLIQCYLQGPGKNVMPHRLANGEPAVELSLQADAGNGWTLTGTLDLAEDGGVDDLKTGSLSRNYSAQLGSYGLLVLSNKILPKLDHLRIQFCKRVGVSKPQPPCQTQEYDVVLAQRYALAIINRVKRDWADYKAMGDIETAFIANPQSLMCTPAYCNAYGTAFCSHGGICK